MFELTGAEELEITAEEVDEEDDSTTEADGVTEGVIDAGVEAADGVTVIGAGTTVT